mgnify:CR=1 FL=1
MESFSKGFGRPMARMNSVCKDIMQAPWGLFDPWQIWIKGLLKADIVSPGSDSWLFKIEPHVVAIPIFISCLVILMGEDYNHLR